MSKKNLFVATRPWSFPASLMPSIIGLILAYGNRNLSGIDFLLSIFSIATVILVQAAGNLVNSYYDFIKGIDKKIKPEDKQQIQSDSTLTDNIITINQLIKLLFTCYLASFITFIFIVTISPARSEILTLLYVLGLASSYFYTGGLALKYKALGDLVIIATFGPLISTFTYTSCCGHLSIIPIYISLPLTINAESILHVNNMRDIKNDKEVGILTLVMLISPRLSRVVMAILLVSPYLFCVITFFYTGSLLFLLPCLTIGMAVDIFRRVRDSQFAYIPEIVAKFHLIFSTCYVMALYYGNINASINNLN